MLHHYNVAEAKTIYGRCTMSTGTRWGPCFLCLRLNSFTRCVLHTEPFSFAVIRCNYKAMNCLVLLTVQPATIEWSWLPTKICTFWSLYRFSLFDKQQLMHRSTDIELLCSHREYFIGLNALLSWHRLNACYPFNESIVLAQWIDFPLAISEKTPTGICFIVIQ